MSQFSTWQLADVLRHNERVRKENRIPAAEAAPAGSEAALHDEILAECRRRGWLAFTGSMATRTHRTEGEPDFHILADRGRSLLVECKTATGKLSPAQRCVIAHAAHLQHAVHVVRSFAGFLALADGDDQWRSREEREDREG